MSGCGFRVISRTEDALALETSLRHLVRFTLIGGVSSLCVCVCVCVCVSGAGADFVMLGGMLAGHDQSGGEVMERDGKKYKTFYGMSSTTAMNKYAGGVKDYR